VPSAPTEKSSARPAEWGYTGEVDPAHWANLNPAYEACAAGVMQSPVDIPTKLAKSGQSFHFSYGSARVTVAHHEHVDDIVDNGHTIQVTVEEGSTLTTAKDTYALKQFHFHTPSENRVAGKSFPMEAHFVHQSTQGAFAVVAVFFKEGVKNENLQKLIDHFPASRGEKVAVAGAIDLSLHVPPKANTFHFLGSFTTPPCTENVEWIVYEKPTTASKEQLAAFASKLGNNNRPTQDFRARPLSVNQLEGGSL
jgi:carbonic anhydrase